MEPSLKRLLIAAHSNPGRCPEAAHRRASYTTVRLQSTRRLAVIRLIQTSLLLAAIIPGVAWAQGSPTNAVEAVMSQFEGTIAVAHTPTFAEGALAGCGIEFNTLVRDWAVRKGSYEKVSGSFGFLMANNKVISPVLKVVVHEVDSATMALTPAAPKRAYVIAEGNSNYASLIKSYPSDTPGALFTLFKTEPSTSMFFGALSDGKLTLRYGRTPSGIDTPLSIDLSVVKTTDDGKRVKSGQPVSEMMACMKNLLKAAQ